MRANDWSEKLLAAMINADRSGVAGIAGEALASGVDPWQVVADIPRPSCGLAACGKKRPCVAGPEFCGLENRGSYPAALYSGYSLQSSPEGGGGDRQHRG